MLRGRCRRPGGLGGSGGTCIADPPTRPIQDPNGHPSLEDAETQEPFDTDVPSNTSVQVSSIRGSCSSGRKRSRGDAKGIPRPTNHADRLPIRILDGRPVGPNRDKFITKIGVWVKDQNNFPFWQRNYDNFQHSKWVDMAMTAREYFDIDFAGDLASILKDNCRKTWNDTRSKLYRDFYESYPHQEAILRIPRGLDTITWTRICDEIFSQPWWRKTSDINTENRVHQQVVHVSGRTSFAQRREDLRTELGRDPNRKELWDRTHVKEDGTSANSHTQEITSRMDELIEQSRQNSGTVDENTIFQEVLGPESRGRIRGQGMGIRRREYISQHPSQQEMQKQITTLHSEQEQLHSEHEQLHSEYEKLKSEHEQLISKYDHLADENQRLNEVVNGLQANFQEISQMFRRDTFATMSSQMPNSQMPYQQQTFTQMLNGGFWAPAPRAPHPTRLDIFEPPQQE